MTHGGPSDFELCPMADGAFAMLVGPLLYRREGDTLRFAFQTTQQHTNARGVIHGGMLFTFADQVLGLTVQHVVGSVAVATVSLNCDLVRAAHPGDFIEGQAAVTRLTRSVVFVKGALYRGETVLLNASGLWMRLGATAPNLGAR